MHPGPTRLWHSTHRILSPGLCRSQRSQSGLARQALLGGTRTACANGELNPGPVLERPLAPNSPSVKPLRSTRIMAPIQSIWPGRNPTGMPCP